MDDHKIVKTIRGTLFRPNAIPQVIKRYTFLVTLSL